MSEHDENPPTSPGPVATGPLVFALCLALLVGGFVLMGVSFDHGSGALFLLGLLASGLAFLVPIHLLRD